MRKIPFRNYLILVLILIVSMAAVIYMNKLYLSAKNDNNILDGFINEIKPQEIDTYIIENPNFVIYLGYKNSDNKSFEKKFKNFVTKYDLQKNIVFIDIKQFEDKKFNDFSEKYASVSLNKNNSLIIIDNQKVIDTLDITKERCDIELVKIFFKKNGVY